MTFLAALRSDRIDAPCMIDGLINGDRFLAWVQQSLLPRPRGGDIVGPGNWRSGSGLSSGR